MRSFNHAAAGAKRRKNLRFLRTPVAAAAGKNDTRCRVADVLQQALATVPPGRYLVAVSGGADSTALARLAAADGRLGIVLAHLNHQLRGEESDADELFVRELAEQSGVPIVVGLLSDWCNSLSNPSASYRTARFEFFASIIEQERLDGVLLAHHADDQAETVLLRILRGATLASLGGMSTQTHWNHFVGATHASPAERDQPQRATHASPLQRIALHRPLLGIRRQALRDYLQRIGQPWREDSSNQSADYERNVVRDWLTREPELVSPLLVLSAAARRWRNLLAEHSPALAEAFDPAALRVPPPLAEFAAGRWLVERGAPPDDVSPAVRERLVAQALDPAAPLRQHYPGGLLVRKRKRRIDVIPSPPIRRPDLESTAASEKEHGQDQTAPAREL